MAPGPEMKNFLKIGVTLIEEKEERESLEWVWSCVEERN